ncbi:hypothetical protein [Psychroserpens sp.]|uniref:hypothetical protein n=1 Tax=Psychroserpens sp. TaxID=2020870 RepID=UPI001B25EA00|nr:hypothetical protein [Psychroserpens sp.]MBO6607187.1 hypothetical protein [Psychroserpens sp.]MBO6654333.1 hypothetical protein [Psychroserpens sp.]MBO6682381.1 hypothetical protein [Psychroserpens sp.]MBO6750959.1 hypothetical protein [Psychroserpens sp.]MBO6915612.1 hypothetical protein [Psychroserpens sp.]
MEKQPRKFNLIMLIGILGVIAGIALIFTDSWFIGVFGGIASAGITYKSYKDSRN